MTNVHSQAGVSASSLEFDELDYTQALFIDGEFCSAQDGNTLEVIEPATEDVFRTISYGSENDVERALESAASGFNEWSRTSVRYRADLLNEVARLLRRRRELIGKILCHETGKRFSEAVAEVAFSAEYFQWFAEEVRRPQGSILSGDLATRRQWEVYEPSGVVGVLTPWNFPVSIQARKIAPALAAGCTIVSRPSEKAPCSVAELFRCMHDAGVPRGVVHLVLGPATQITERMFSHPAIRLVTFTGSTRIGKELMRLAANRVVKLSLELGGNAAFLVHRDADIDRAIDGAMLAKFRNNGQSCIAANRFFVHESRYQEFIEHLGARIGALRVGDPMDEGTDLGPVIDRGRKKALDEAVREAVAAGAEVVSPEVAIPRVGSYVSPRLLTNVPMNSLLGCDEIFGPVAGVYSYADLDGAIEAANNSSVGLASYVYTNSLPIATRVSESLRAGIVGVNNALPAAAFAPMGGVKESGFGREGGGHGLREFQEIKYVSMELT